MTLSLAILIITSSIPTSSCDLIDKNEYSITAKFLIRIYFTKQFQRRTRYRWAVRQKQYAAGLSL